MITNADIRCALHELVRCGLFRHWCLSMLPMQHLFADAAVRYLQRSRFHESGHSNPPSKTNSKLPFRCNEIKHAGCGANCAYAVAVIADAAFLCTCSRIFAAMQRNHPKHPLKFEIRCQIQMASSRRVDSTNWSRNVVVNRLAAFAAAALACGCAKSLVRRDKRLGHAQFVKEHWAITSYL